MRSLGMLVALAAIAVATPVQARGLAPFEMTPQSGPAGTLVTATSGPACVPPEWATSASAIVDMWSRATRVSGWQDHASRPTVVATGSGAVEADGTWTATFVVPADAHPGVYAIEVHCWAANQYGGFEPYFDYADVEFRVTQ